jgi:hypothetical protein
MPSSLEIVRKFFPEVETVSDAKKTLHVSVTRRDSNSSAVKNHKGCAMAVACKREYKLDGVVISRERAYLVKDNKAVRYALPESISREVVSFDRNAGFAEGEYQLSVPPKPSCGPPKRVREDRAREGYVPRFAHQTEGIRTALGSKNAV